MPPFLTVPLAAVALLVAVAIIAFLVRRYRAARKVDAVAPIDTGMTDADIKYRLGLAARPVTYVGAEEALAARAAAAAGPAVPGQQDPDEPYRT